MSSALEGVKILEVAAWTFVPAAGAVLADWGADVIKVEHPVMGDPQRGLVSMGLIPGGDSAINYIIEQPNRGKRSIGLDISTDDGPRHPLQAGRAERRVRHQLPARRPPEAADRRRAHPGRQPEHRLRPRHRPGPEGPRRRQGRLRRRVLLGPWWRLQRADPGRAPSTRSAVAPAFGDLAGGMSIAGGIAAALFQRERTGEASIIDVSLLGLAMWVLSPDVVASGLYGGDPMPKFDHKTSANPLVGFYRTKDDRYLTLMLLQGDRFWPELCEHMGRPELIDDERFADGGARFANNVELVELLDETFASRTLDEWRVALDDDEGRLGAGADAGRAGATTRRSRPTATSAPSRSTASTSTSWPARADGRDGRRARAGARARPAHRGDPPRAGHRVGRDRQGQGIRRHPLSAAGSSECSPADLDHPRRSPVRNGVAALPSASLKAGRPAAGCPR